METRKKKSFKRLFAFLMAFVMVASLAVSAVFAAPTFKDVPADHDFYVEIEDLAAKGIVGGYGTTGLFKPEENLTRAQAAKMIALAAGLEAPAGFKSKLTDVDSNVDMYEHIWALEKAGVVKGFGKTNEYRPEENITRGHVAKMVAMAFGLEEGDVDFAFSDLPKDDKEVKEAIEILASNGIVSGYGKTGLFKPDELVTRGQFAKMVSKAMAVADDQAAFAVVSVKALNGVEVEVVFNHAIDKTSAQTASNYTASLNNTGTAISPASATRTGAKTVKLRYASALAGKYMFNITGVKDAAGATIDYHEWVVFAADKEGPSIIGVERVSANVVKVKFSEPIWWAASGALSAKYVDATITPQLVAGDVTVGTTLVAVESAILNKTNAVSELAFTLSSNVKVDKDVLITFNGVVDVAGNLIVPQPATQVISKATPSVAPKLVSIAQESARTFSVAFDQDILTDLTVSDITVTGYSVTAVDRSDDADNEFIVTVGANLDGLQKVTIAAHKADNVDGIASDVAQSMFITFVEDKAQPVATAKLIVGSDNKEYIELTFDKDVTFTNVTINGKYVKDYVTTTLTALTVVPTYADGKGAATTKTMNVLRIPLATDADPTKNLAVKGAEYSVAITSDNVKSDNGLAMKAVSFTYVRGEDGLPPATPTDKVVTQVVIAQDDAHPDIVYVDFTFDSGEKLDGATATNLANYSIAGAQIESVSLAAASGSSQRATLTLVKGSNTFTGVRNITIQGVKLAGSTKTMTPVTISDVSLNENVRPTVVKAVLTDLDKVELTLSEKVNASAVNTDFELLIGGKTVATNKVVTTGAASGSITVTLTLEAPVSTTDVASGLSLTALATLGITDTVGNILDVTTVTIQIP